VTRTFLIAIAALAIAACNSDQDKIDNLAAAEGVARNEPEPEVEPEPLPPPVVNLPAPLPEADLDVPPEAEPEPADDLAPAPATPPPTAARARPSFDCSGDLNRVEAMICATPELARLDRQVAGAYVRATRRADSDQAVRLERIGRRYIADRNRCPTDYCVRQAYRWYLRDIEGIMGSSGN
jgi:hypothetical protein